MKIFNTNSNHYSNLLFLHLLCDISIHDFLASLMLQLLLARFTQTVVDHTVHIAGAALVQILFGDFAITIVTADLQLVHAVRMLGEESLELVNQNPGSRLPDVLMHRRRNTTNHPTVTITATNLCTNLLGLRAVPQLIPSLIVQVAHNLFVLGAIARHNIAIRVDEEGIEAHVARQQNASGHRCS